MGTRSRSGQSGVQAKLLSALLNEMDGIGIKQDQAVSPKPSSVLRLLHVVTGICPHLVSAFMKS